MGQAILMGGGGGGVFSGDVTATKANVLAGTTTVTSDSNDEVVQGTMVNRGAVSQSLAINGSYTIPQGYHNGNGKVTQSISTRAATTYYAGTSAQTIPAGLYLSGNQTIAALSHTNLAAANIKKGTTISIKNGNGNVWSVTGTWEGYVPTATIPFNRGTWASGYSIIGQRPRESNYSRSVGVTYPGSSIHIVPASGESGGYPGGAYLIMNRMTMNGKSTINISVSGNIGAYNASDGASRKSVLLGIWNDVSAGQLNTSLATAYIMTTTTISSTSETTITLNVGTITTDQYICFGAWAMASATSYLDVTRIWFT